MSMTCIEFRQIVGADPNSRSPGLAEHRLSCRACAEFAQAQEALTRKLQRAMQVPVPSELPARILLRKSLLRSPVNRWLALAASVMLTIGIGFGVWHGNQPSTLGNDVMAHVLDHEPELLTQLDTRASARKVKAVLNRGGFRLSGELDDVTHAGLCPFRGRLVPHLVMDVDGHAVSVLLLSNEAVPTEESLHEGGYDGVIVPVKHGSIAIVAPRADLIIPMQRKLEKLVHSGI